MSNTPETIKLLGGRLCLDFANTVDRQADDSPVAGSDALADDDAMERWGRRVGLLAAADGRAGELARGRALRDALYALFAGLARGERPPADALARLGDEFGEAAAAARLVSRGDGFALDWPPEDPRRVRYAVAADAFALLNEPDLLARVSRCPGRACGWLFLDTSGRRRWCSMATCGSREKMRRMYARKRAAR